MKTNILRISILPLLVLGLLLFNYQPGNKGNGKNDQESSRNDNKDDRKSNGNKGSDDVKRNDQPQKSDDKDKKGNENKGQKDDDNRGKDFDNDDRGNDKGNKNKGNDGKDKFDNDKKGKVIREEISMWNRRDVDWGVNDYKNRKRPKDLKKVNICHKTGNDGYPVTINVSENAVQAHLNHGDQLGSCTTRYSDNWTPGYINARENVYNNYENTWETMSYSESLLAYAMEKLLGVRSNLNTNRSTYSSSELQRKEAIINDLQQNVNALQTQLNVTEKRMDGLNITIQL